MTSSLKAVIVYILIAEIFFACQLLLLTHPSYGILTSAASVILLFLFSLKRPAYNAIASCVAIIIAVKMAAVTISIEDPGTAALMLYGILGAAVLIYSGIRSWPNFIPKISPPARMSTIAGAFLAGELLGLITWILLPMDDPFRVLPRLALIITAPVAAIIEEFVFRANIQSEAEGAIGKWNAVIFAAWITGGFSLSSNNAQMILILLVNLIISYSYSRAKSTSLTFIVNLSMKLTFIALLALKPMF